VRTAARTLVAALWTGCVALRQWRARARQRRALAQLDDHLSRDIGLTRAVAFQASRKPPWQA
jgi:uncharacterized protein YjiS (DUF1127 family)